MSVDGTRLLFEGFLQKRKDTMKMRWVTYWFRLQNTTLFFYTQKNGSAAKYSHLNDGISTFSSQSHLRGYYYIYTVQSVREVQRADRKRFMFEIIMTSGKRKVLAAATAALQREWVGYLWQAMHLSTSVVSDSRSTHLEVCEEQERQSSSTAMRPHVDSVMESLPAWPLSAPAPTGHIHHDIWSVASPICPSEELGNEEATHQTAPQAWSYHHHNGDGLSSPQWSSGLSYAEGTQEGDYDILPLRNKVCKINTPAEVDDGVYDVPLSYRSSAEHPNPTDSIYDVPSCLMRRTPDHTLEEQPEDGVYWRI